MDLAHHAVQVVPELFDIDFLARRKEDTRRVGFCDPALLQIFQRKILTRGRGQVVLVLADERVSVDLVKDQKNRFIARPDLLQGLLHHVDLLLEIRM